MSTANEKYHPYYNKYDTPVLTDSLQKAVFNGRLAKVKNLIAADRNVYKTTAKDESLHFIAIARDHKSIANLLIDILEQDLKSLQCFFGKYQIPNTFWLNEISYVVFGKEHIDQVKQLATGLLVENADEMLRNSHKGLILLLKPSNVCEPEVLWLRARCKQDIERIARIIECIVDDGTIEVMRTEHWGRTLLDVAVYRYFSDIFFRLLELFGSVSITDMKCMEYLCILSKRSNLASVVQYFNVISARAAEIMSLRTFVDIITTPGGEGLLMIPAYQDLFDLFAYFIHSVAERRMVELNISKEEAVSLVINTQKSPTNTAFMEMIWWGSDFALKCLQFNPDLLTVIDNQTFLQTFLSMQPNHTIADWVIDHFDAIRKKGLADQVVKTMITRNWSEAVKRLYGSHPDAKETLFRDHKKGITKLMTGIDQSHYEMVEFLVNAHRSELTNPEDLAGLVLYSVFTKRGLAVLRTLLTLPDVDVLRRSSEDHYYRSPFYVALKFYHLDNYRELLSYVKDPKDLIGLKEDNGDNLLAMAIWFKQKPVDEKPFVYIEEEKLSLEIVDSSDDEEEVMRKISFNTAVENPPNLYPDEVFPEIYFSTERDELNAIFDNLLAIGVDYMNVNNDGQSLLHLAVKNDNLYVVKKLLDLGVPANSVDNNGNRPVHGVLSVAVFLELRRNAGADDMNVKNVEGETPLHTLVKQVEAKDDELIREMITAGAKINITDNAGNTPLHLVANLALAKALLKNGADVNATNANGENAALCAHRLRLQADQELMKFLVSQDNIDLLALTNNGVSMLSIFANMNEKDFADILPVLLKRPIQLDDLFQKHCNTTDQGQPVMCSALSSYTNSYCLKKLLHLDELQVNIHQLLTASTIDDHEAVQVLLEKGVDINRTDNSKTPLMLSIDQPQNCRIPGRVKVGFMLLMAGADTEIKDERGATAIEYARALENRKDACRILAALILAGAKYMTKFDEKLPLAGSPFKCMYEIV